VASKVLLVVIDAATPHVVCPAVQTGRLPVMRRLAEAGDMHTQSVSMFPSITPAATSTIITGTYPCEHGIAGASWFDTTKNEVAYYGDDFWIIVREGFGHFVNDFLLRLNGDRMRAPTLFQMVERTGRTAGSLNYLVYKGNVLHKVNVPKLVASLPGVPLSETVEGPSLLCLGDFAGARTPHGHKPKEKGGLLHRFGMDDASTASMLKDLAGKRAFPDFTVAYFADNDYVSHEVGPVAALPVIERVDEALGETFEAFGGMDRFLEETAVIITSDHGHCDVLATPAAVIRLDQVLADFRQAALGAAWRTKDEIMICPNMRAAQIYVQQPSAEIIERLASTLLTHPDVDQVMWRSRLTGDDGQYTVVSHRGRLTFSRGSGPNSGTDDFGGTWNWSGEETVLGLSVDGGSLHFDHYPNAFERIAGVLDLEQSGEVWVTAKPGCEFEVPGGKAHVGGASHGALHALDSYSPVIMAGGGSPMRLPRAMRSVDIAPLCMQILGIPMRYRVGEPRR
jgi:hypothetical protein